jgi:hypothetical protein
MSTLVTPSAKSHERVTGRWVRDLEISSRREWMIYYTKQIIGTPIPWLLSAFACLLFFSRAGLEMAGWACATLTLVYIFADRMSRTREFSFFRIGGDFFLFGLVITAIVGASSSTSLAQSLSYLGGIRWVILLYMLTYCWELFPGMNRIFFLLVGAAVVASSYGVYQHFMGLDLIRNTELMSAPVPGRIYFTASGFFTMPEAYGTILASVLPFPAAAFLLSDRRTEGWERWFSLFLVLLISTAIFWTYRPGMWIAALGGIAIVIVMQTRQMFPFLLVLFTFLIGLSFVSYGSPNAMLEKVQQAEMLRSEHQREQINTQVALWQKNSWIGVGQETQKAENYDPGTGNVYFQMLAQLGVFGVTFFMLFILSFLLSTYRVFKEIPQTHYWHRVLIAGALGSQIAFHTAGLYWSTFSEALALNFFILVLASVSYLTEHYGRGLVPDDYAL